MDNQATSSNVDGQQPGQAPKSPMSGVRDSKGWDGKLRIDRSDATASQNGDSEAEESEEEGFPQTDVPGGEIAADEDLLDDYGPESDDIDLNHSRISSIPALHLERFHHVQKLCLRQNVISHVQFPASLNATLQDLDLYDNGISHIKGLVDLVHLTSLDLSFNKIKHIKNVQHLKELRDIYFVQNKIQKIEGLDGLSKIRNLELASNRIREIENLETLEGLEELWLGKNKIIEIKNISHLSNLKILSIQSNRLTTISGLDNLVSLEEIYISHNALTEISGLDHNVKLRVLDISNNQIKHLQGLKHLSNLEELWASCNQLSSFDEVEKELKDKDSLETVYFEANPLQLQSPATYRNKVRLALPQIRQIDATYVRVS